MKIKIQANNRKTIKPTGKENVNPNSLCSFQKESNLVPTFPIVMPSLFKVNLDSDPALQPYEQTILKYLIESESEFRLNKKTKSKICKDNKRTKIVDFFGIICSKYKLRKRTFFLGVHYFDQYINKKPTLNSEKLAIIAQTCLFIAMKYQEIYPPRIKDWASNIDKIYQCQSQVLKELNFKLQYTTAQHYLELYLNKHPMKNPQQQMYQCILELYLTTGKIYDDHPLKIVEKILSSFQPFFLSEHPQEMQKEVKNLILKNGQIWESILKHNIIYLSK